MMSKYAIMAIALLMSTQVHAGWVYLNKSKEVEYDFQDTKISLFNLCEEEEGYGPAFLVHDERLESRGGLFSGLPYGGIKGKFVYQRGRFRLNGNAWFQVDDGSRYAIAIHITEPEVHSWFYLSDSVKRVDSSQILSRMREGNEMLILLQMADGFKFPIIIRMDGLNEALEIAESNCKQ